MSPTRLIAVIGSVVVIITATLLPFNPIVSSQIPPTWCLRCGGLWLTDAVSNVLLFVPLGASLVWCGMRVAPAVLFGLLGSFAIEWLQSRGIPAARSAALADVITNTLGTAAGALIVAYGAWLRRPGARAARWLAIVWTAAACLTAILTAQAIGPRGQATAHVNVQASLSPYTHVPGQAYFGGVNESATVGARDTFRKGWGGPIIIELNAEPDTLQVTSMVRGREAEPFAVPIVFLHLPRDSSPVMQVRVNRDAAELDVTRRAWDWGMNFPTVRLERAFAGRTLTDTTALTLHARASRHQLELAAEQGERREYVRVSLTPTVGWVMLQNLVDVQSPWAPVVLVAWLCTLMAPIGWWSAQTATAPGRDQAPLAILQRETWIPYAIVVLMVWIALAGIGHTAVPTVFETALLLLWCGIGHWAARRGTAVSSMPKRG